jgi:tRNA pseudouridine55 synthase
VDGLVLVDKPAGKTSHDLTLATRRGLGVRKAGHAGTLDPFATGLLLVLVGRARRVQRFLMALPKSYEAVARLGAVSTTGDPEGEITVTGTIPPDPFVLPTGVVRQRPPIYSAVRVQGMKAYERARRGETVDIPEREVTVYRFEQRWREDDRAAFVIECSSGTYVRSLIADVGDAYCEELRRTRTRRGSCRWPVRSASCPRWRSTPTRRGAPGTARPSRARRRTAPAARCCSSTRTARSRSPSRATARS